MELLHNPVRDYAWGSRVTIAAAQGRPVPSPHPEAELWMGAHPDDPSAVDRDGRRISLAELIGADPVGVLGPVTVARFGPRLPYLMKLLAAEQPLSLQAHPDNEQARTGYAAQSHLAGNDRNRVYRDPYHKPELLVAVEPFLALCGFRDPAVSRRVFTELGVPALEPVIRELSRTGDDSDGSPGTESPGAGAALRHAVELLLRWPEDRREAVVAGVRAAARDRLDGFPVERDIVLDLSARYPADMGVLVALLLNPVRLEPGEGIWMPAGNLHAYLRGAGVEVMAASDNVLRGGLTPKYVDVDELMRVLRYEVLDDPVVRPVEIGAGVVTWPTPAEEFALTRVAVHAGSPPVALPGSGPRVVFCWRGRAVLGSAGEQCPILAGQAAFVPPTMPGLSCSGDAVLFQAAVPAN